MRMLYFSANMDELKVHILVKPMYLLGLRVDLHITLLVYSMWVKINLECSVYTGKDSSAIYRLLFFLRASL